MYICTDVNGYYGEGKTLEIAFKNYQETGDDTIDDCTFYQAEQIEVETKIVKKEIPIPKSKSI